jgi:hypothetical protein
MSAGHPSSLGIGLRVVLGGNVGKPPVQQIAWQVPWQLQPKDDLFWLASEVIGAYLAGA